MSPTPVDAIKTPDEKWEDQAFVNLHRDIFHEINAAGHIDPDRWRFPNPQIKPEHVQRWRGLAQARCLQPLWGFKDPRFPFLMDLGIGILAGLGANIKIIWLTRDINAVARSLHKRDGGSLDANLAVATVQMACWHKMSTRYSGWAGCQLQYENILANPEATVRLLTAAVHVPLPPELLDSTVALIKRPEPAIWWPI